MAGIRLAIDPTGMESGGRRAESALDRVKREARETDIGVNRSVDNMGGGVKRFAATAGRQLGLAAAAFISLQAVMGTVNTARDFNAALAETSTLIQGTPAEMDELSASARQLAKDFGTGATAQVEAFYQAISAGAGSVTDAATLLESANKLAVGGATDTTTAVDILTTATNVYSASGLTAAQASDALFVAMKAGKTTIGELAGSLGKVLPLSEKMGVSFDETAAAVAALTKGGISTAESVTGLRAAMTSVLGPSKEASDLAKKLGIEFSASAVEAKGFAGFMEDVVQRTGGGTTALQTLFGSVEATTVALALSGSAGKSFSDILEGMRSKTGMTQEAFDKMSASLDQRWSRATASAMDIAMRFGNVFLGLLVPALEAVASGLNSLDGFFEKLQGHSSRVDSLSRATDNLTLAMGDEIKQASTLFALMGKGTTMTQSMALAKLSEAEVHLRNAAALRDEKNETVKLQVAVLELERIRQQGALNALRTPGDDIDQMPSRLRDAYQALESTLAQTMADQQALNAQVDPLSDKFSEAQAEVDRIREALKNVKDGMVAFNGETYEAVELTDRLAALAGGVNFSGAVSSAQELSQWLGISLSTALQLSKTTPDMADEDLLMSQTVIVTAKEREQQRAALANLHRLTKPTATSGGGGSASEIDQTTQAYNSLLASLDPVVRATQEFEAAQKTINAALEGGKIGAYEAETAFKLAQERFVEASATARGLSGAWDTFAESGGSAIDKLIQGTGSLRDVLKETIAELTLAYAKSKLLASVSGGTKSDSIGSLIFKGFAGLFDEGGTIGTGQTGIVGERGPELVKSTSRGAVVTSRAETSRRLSAAPVQATVQVVGGDLKLTDDGKMMAQFRVIAGQAGYQAVETVKGSLSGWNTQLQQDGALV